MIEIKHAFLHNWKRAGSPACLLSACRRGILLSAAILAMAITGWGQPSPQPNRITQELSSGGLIRLPGSVHRLTQKATDLGPVNRGMRLNTLTLHFGPSAEQQIELDALMQAQQDPKSPQYHQWLTQEEYGARFGLSDADLSKITEWLQSQGFIVRGVSKSRNAMYFSGTAAQVETAFHTQLHRYVLNGEQHFANATELQLPEGLRGVVLTVRGLNDFRLKPHLRKRQAVPGFTFGSQDSPDHALSPGDWATIYNVNAFYAAGFAGTGMHLGVVGQTYAPQSEIDRFRSAAHLSTTKLNYVCISTSDCTSSAGTSTGGDLGEAHLDIEWAGGIANDATVDYVYAAFNDPNQGVFEALAFAVQSYKIPGTNTPLPVISMSYTDCEESFVGNAGYKGFVENLGEQANSQGQTIVVSSGDTGVAGCDSQEDSVASHGVSATVPVDSPNFTGVGGTTLSGDVANPANYWNQTPWDPIANNTVISALRYIPETVWNDTAIDHLLLASGGGVSLFFAQPPWQPTPGNYSGPGGRFIPDVSFSASADHDGYLVCSSVEDPQFGTPCTTGFVSDQGFIFLAGGTSAGAPAFAGMLTLLVQKLGPQGNINPTLYGIAAANPAVFHDITIGNNKVPCKFGTSGCVGGSAGLHPTPGTMGFTATTGYDLTTGLGSMDGGALLAGMSPDFALTAAHVPSPSARAGSSTDFTLDLSAWGGFSGTVNFSCSNLPPQSTCVFTPDSVNVSSTPLEATIKVTITTTERSAVTPPRGVPPAPWTGAVHEMVLSFGVLFLAATGLAGLGRRTRRSYGFALLVLGGCLFQSACGGGTTTTTQGTPAGTYVITVTAGASGTQHSTTIKLKVT